MFTQQKNNTTVLSTLSTIASDVSVDTMQTNLETQRNIWLEGYLSKDFDKINSVLSPDFRCINGKEIITKDKWHEILANVWQSNYWKVKPLLPNRTRYHFFTPTECMVTLYFKNEKYVNVMQELWMKTDNSWQFNALSTVNR